MNSTENESERDHNLEGFYAYKDTFDQDNVWVEVPRTSQTLPTSVRADERC